MHLLIKFETPNRREGCWLGLGRPAVKLLCIQRLNLRGLSLSLSSLELAAKHLTPVVRLRRGTYTPYTH